jgi:hypothetical protein
LRQHGIHRADQQIQRHVVTENHAMEARQIQRPGARNRPISAGGSAATAM